MDGYVNDLRALLSELGYDILERQQVWAECLLLRGEEQWVGRGRDKDEALRDAVLRALPSYAARVLLERALKEPAAPAAQPPAAASPEPQGRPDGGGAATAVAPERRSAPIIRVV